jgi:hypothetical protein
MTIRQEKLLEQKVRKIYNEVLKEEYYASELSKLNTTSGLNIVIRDGDGNKTKTIDLNNESIPTIINFLKKIKG